MQRLLTVTCLTVALLSGPAHAQAFDHSAFDALLRQHVVNGMVDYDAFDGSPAFRDYLTALSRQDPARLGRDEQLAFWINAYNAYTIRLIVKHDERESIRNINKIFFLRLEGPWGEPLARVGGTDYTLDDIEHTIIRPTFREPRIHFALVCAAMGCPPLRAEAYTGATLEAQLQDQGRRFITQSPTRNRVDLTNGVVHHSKIFTWYKDDFGGSIDRVARFMAGWYAEQSPERALLTSGRFKAVETEYDWTLNSQENFRRLAGR